MSAPALHAIFSMADGLNEEDVQRLVHNSLERNNGALLVSVKSALGESISQIKRVSTESAESQIREPLRS